MEKVKYPRTPHLPISGYVTNDDKVLKDYSNFYNKEIIITEKLDGENTTMYKKWFHARSLDSTHHSSRDWVKGLWSSISYMIPDSYRICGENMYAKHSIEYKDLETYFYVFNIWDNNTCLSYEDTLLVCESLGLVHVPLLYKGIFDINKVEDIFNNLDKTKKEGIVIRNVNSFIYEDFNKNVAKAVRQNHVTTDKHWSNQKIIKNQLK